MDIKAWLKDKKVTARAYDADQLLNNFLSEMEKGLTDEGSSLEMIPAYVNSDGTVPARKPVAVIDAGGTNLRIALAQFDDEGKVQLSHFSKQRMPGKAEEIEPDGFYDVVCDALEAFKDEFDHIGFCFSYPAEILPNFDGRLIKWSKEVKIPKMVGTCVGEGLIKALDARGIKGKKAVLLNDTVATMLAGLSEGQRFGASSYIGFILGTGTNTSYVEENSNITKVEGLDQSGHQAINVESGGFAAFDRGPVDIIMADASASPDTYLFEKVLSGAYMGGLTLQLVRELAKEHDGIISASGVAKANEMPNYLKLMHIDNLAAKNGRDIGDLGSEEFSDADRDIFRTVFTAVVERAALLAAVNIAAAVIKCGKGQDPDHPVCVNIDGSTYYMTLGMVDLVQGHLKSILGSRGLHIKCIHVDDAPVVGGAIAGLTSF